MRICDSVGHLAAAGRITALDTRRPSGRAAITPISGAHRRTHAPSRVARESRYFYVRTRPGSRGKGIDGRLGEGYRVYGRISDKALHKVAKARHDSRAARAPASGDRTADAPGRSPPVPGPVAGFGDGHLANERTDVSLTFRQEGSVGERGSELVTPAPLSLDAILDASRLRPGCPTVIRTLSRPGPETMQHTHIQCTPHRLSHPLQRWPTPHAPRATVLLVRATARADHAHSLSPTACRPSGCGAC